MGANFITKNLETKYSVTQNNAVRLRKEWAKIVEDDQFENGHNGYSGSWGTMTLSVSGLVFSTFAIAYDHMSEVGDKGVAYAVQVKVAKLGKRFETLTKQINDITHQLTFSREEIPTRTRNALQRKRIALEAKRKTMEEEAGLKSTKTRWVLMGWARS